MEFLALYAFTGLTTIVGCVLIDRNAAARARAMRAGTNLYPWKG